MKSKLLLTLLTATCLFSSCTKENEVNMPQDKSEGNKVTFIVNTAPVTRTTVNTTNNSTKFVENDKIGIFELSTSITDANNYEYKVLSDGTLEAADVSKTLYYPSDANENINFYAYYPFNPEAAATDKVEFTIADDQSSEALYNANDFMAATTNGKKTDFTDGVSLTFSHKLALVQLTLIGDDASKVTAVTLNNCQPTTTWTFSSNVIEAASGTVQDIKMWKITADANTYWALVPAQTITTKMVLFTMTAGETTYTYKPSAGNIVFTNNKIKKFNIQLGTNGNTIAVSTDMNTNGWEGKDDPAIDGKGEIDVPKPVDLVQGGDMEEMTKFENAAGSYKTKITAGTWGWAQYAPSEGSADIQTDAVQGKVLHMNFNKPSGATGTYSWYNKTIFYHCENGTRDLYKLSFKAKAVSSTISNPNLYVVIANVTSGNKFFPENTLKCGLVKKEITKDNWNIYELTFDLTKYTATGNESTQTTLTNTDATIVSDFFIGFTPRNNSDSDGVDFYIDDVSLIKVTE